MATSALFAAIAEDLTTVPNVSIAKHNQTTVIRLQHDKVYVMSTKYAELYYLQ